MIRISSISLEPVKKEPIEATKKRLYSKLLKLLRVSEIKQLCIARKSLDARKKDNVKLVFTVDIALDEKTERALLKKKIKNINITKPDNVSFNPMVSKQAGEKANKIFIVGAGPAGLFAAYMLILNGYKPVVLERGYDVDRRQQSVDDFWEKGVLDKKSNVQFGEGGAGTFSDGKLNTGVKDPEGRISYVLSTFVKYGARENILYEQKPHVGTDVLKTVIKNLRNAIIAGGGEVRFENCLTDIGVNEEKLKYISINGNETVDADVLVLAIGHSSRDTFEMLRNKKIDMQAKDFAVGFRVIHPQEMINVSQYGEDYADYFEAASYKLTAKSSDERGVYSFCMCPGGYVVNASSEENRVCVNGMSYSDRGASSANSAIIVAVKKDDFVNELRQSGMKYEEDDPLLGMYFQRLLEERTWKKGEGKVPVQKYGDYKAEVKGEVDEVDYEKEFVPEIKGEYIFTSLKDVLPADIENAFVDGMESMGNKIKGFNSSFVVLAGTETRTSSPVRICRDEMGLSSIEGIYPCGEGAGYAGGIVSAAVDGLRVAEKIIKGIENA